MAKTVEYGCHGARVKCDQGSVESKLKATDFTEIGNNLLITNRDTTFKSFTSTFGNCKRMNGQACVMQALPEWFDTNDDFATGMGISVVTTDSILICMTGGGAIRPLDSGQISDDVGFLDGFQTVLDVVGLIPVAGEVADGVNALIYAARKDYVNMTLSVGALMPIGGQAPTIAKLASKAVKYSDEAAALAKNADEIAGAVKANPNNVKVKVGQQDKHIPGTHNYKQSVESGINRSVLKENPQQLLDEFAGTGQKIGANKERVDFGKVIGQYYDAKTNTYVDTTRGIIHYDSKGGAHIIPSAPNGY